MSEKKGLMSSKVLNMKFMRAAKIKEEEKKVEVNVMKLKDLSEWKTEGAEALKAKTKSKPKVVSIGYSNLNALHQSSVPMVGRRVFGEDPKKDTKAIQLEEEEKEEDEIDRAFRVDKEEIDRAFRVDKEERNSKPFKRYTDAGIPKNNKKRKPSHQ